MTLMVDPETKDTVLVENAVAPMVSNVQPNAMLMVMVKMMMVLFLVSIVMNVNQWLFVLIQKKDIHVVAQSTLLMMVKQHVMMVINVLPEVSVLSIVPQRDSHVKTKMLDITVSVLTIVHTNWTQLLENVLMLMNV